MQIEQLMTKKEALRLYRSESPEICFWAYYGVPNPRHPKVAKRLIEELRQFGEIAGDHLLLYRHIGRGGIVVMMPELFLCDPRTIVGQEGTVLIGAEGNDLHTWIKAVELYRLIRRVFLLGGRGGKPGEISWNIVAECLQQNPADRTHCLELLAKENIRRWLEEWGRSEAECACVNEWPQIERDAHAVAYEQMKSGLAHARQKKAKNQERVAPGSSTWTRMHRPMKPPSCSSTLHPSTIRRLLLSSLFQSRSSLIVVS